MAVFGPILGGAIDALREASATVHRGVTGQVRQDSAATIELHGLMDDLRSIADDETAQKMMAEIIQRKAYEVQQLMVTYAPVRTGELRRSIEVRISEGGQYAEVEPMAPYAGFVEYGTGVYSEFGNGQPYEIKATSGDALRFVVNGQVVFAKKVIHMGIQPQPFVRLAALDATADFADLIADGAVNLIINTPNAKMAGMTGAPPSLGMDMAPEINSYSPQQVRREAA